jgi:SAM-dependent methyltransferase
VVEGVLVCKNTKCLPEYPIIDGIPIIVDDLRTYVSQNIIPVLSRQDLSPVVESLVRDCCGPGSAYEVQCQQVSTYAYDHYAELDPEESEDDAGRPSSVVSLLRSALDAVGEPRSGPVVDIGCAVGRTSFELAQDLDELVLGVDLNFGMLRVGASILAGKGAKYAKRRVGIVYEHREFPVTFEGAGNVDFWACDATCLPLADGSVSLALSLNVIDCVASPYDHLQELCRILPPGGNAVVATPYDWNPGATPVESWLGGHSQRSELAGQSDAILRSLLAGGEHPLAIEALELIQELPVLEWGLRLHDRSAIQYLVHMMVLAKK